MFRCFDVLLIRSQECSLWLGFLSAASWLAAAQLNKEVISYQLELRKKPADVNWMLQSSSEWKAQTNSTTYSHALLRYMSLEVMGRWWLLLPSSLLSQWSSNQRLPVLHPSWSTPLRVSSGCAGPPSPDLVSLWDVHIHHPVKCMHFGSLTNP